MSYSKDIYRKAEEILRRKKQSAITETDMRREKIFAEIPRAKEIEQLISRSGIAAAKAVLSGAKSQIELQKLKNDNIKLQNELKEILLTYGYSEDDLDIKYSCQDCNDSGYIDGKMCQCMKKILCTAACDELNALSPLDLSTFESFKLTYYSDKPDTMGKVPRKRLSKIMDFCIEYAEKFNATGKSILMEGGTGLGKTHLSLAIAQRVIDCGFGVVYTSVPNILRELEREHFSKSAASDTKNNLEQCDLLILDDLGTEFATSFTKSTVYNIINTRMMMSKPVIVNTNLSLSELKIMYSERFISRFIGEHYYLEFIGEDIRLLKRKTNL